MLVCLESGDTIGVATRRSARGAGGANYVITISGITDVVGPGPVSFKLYCNEEASGIRYFEGRLSFVALSPSEEA